MKYLILLISLWLAPAYGCDHTFKVSIDSWPPFFVKEQEGWTGLDVEILKQAIAGAGCQIEFVYIPPRRGLKYIAIGKIDIMMAASYTKSRAEFGYFSTPYRDELIGIMMPKGLSNLYPANRLTDIFNQDIYLSTQRGAWYGDEFEEIKKSLRFQSKIHYANSEAQAIDLLMHQRVDGVATDVMAGLFKARELGFSGNIEFHPYLLNSSKVSFYVSKKSVPEALFNKLNDSLNNYLESDEYKALLSSYLSKTLFQNAASPE
ncbi:transporter substrate-binding domain-containing protein [Motilimonas sp. 1_MG-2023]|uniref:substrate-binding periplasmic protein n=1 Tax=Motilimonas sp. 1_MG-2023 TaxID=3062672 RepID=UPI0026E1F5D3|nr:transporter substrate-binding domain-containing protein [Motilimonas sp. 1_MG-2023]MDO6525215.1 transporter substrate-binding domain-containing protein [Motilimonas sp. 1_MG-2023]